MRLYLLPISTRRTLIYCQKSKLAATGKPGIVDRITHKAAETWAGWEKYEKGWQKTLTEYGNKGLQRIPYEEWGLKSIPPLSTREKEGLTSRDKIDVVFPRSVLKQSEVLSMLNTLATERMALHKSRFIYSLIGIPITAPLGLIPVIPNIPCFYLIYRAWSHWRAMNGSKHLQFLLEKNLLRPLDSIDLNKFYAGSMMKIEASRKNIAVDSREVSDAMLLTNATGRQIAVSLQIPELQIELERAVWQVSTSLEEKQKAETRETSTLNEKEGSSGKDQK